jgi:hypothetical protein
MLLLPSFTVAIANHVTTLQGNGSTVIPNGKTCKESGSQYIDLLMDLDKYVLLF